MHPKTIALPALAAGFAALLLGGCQAPTSQAQAAPLQFEITDLGNPAHPVPVTAPSGTELDLPAVFDVEIRLVGVDPSTVQEFRTTTTTYTPQCNDRLIPEQYRTKVVVYPYDVTGAAPTPTSLPFVMPLSSRTLMELGFCTPHVPLTGDVHFQAQLLTGGRAWSTSDLVLHIQPLPKPPEPEGG